MKRLLVLFLALVFCLSFSGCYLDDFTSSEQDKLYEEGIRIFKEYLAKARPNAKIKTVSDVHYLGDNHQMQLTEFMKGEYQDGSKNLKFAVNVKTGDIYTSEQTELYNKKLTTLINEMLGLQWTAVKPAINISSLVTLHGKKKPLHSNEGELRDLLPVNITNLDAFVRDSFKNKNLSVSMHFIYTGAPLRPQTIVQATADKFSENIHLNLQRFPEALQKEVEAAGIAAWGTSPQWPINEQNCLATESMKLSGSTKYEYTQWQEYKGQTPFTIHYPAYILIIEKQPDSSFKEEKSTFDITRDMQIIQKGNQFEFVTKDNRPLNFYVFMDNLDSADNIKEIAARNRKFHDAAYNEFRWQPVLGRWCVGSRSDKFAQLYHLKENDLIIIGNEALTKLQPKQKNSGK